MRKKSTRKFTSGTWKYDKDFHEIKCGWKPIASLDFSRGEVNANASLLLHAPDMYDFIAKISLQMHPEDMLEARSLIRTIDNEVLL